MYYLANMQISKFFEVQYWELESRWITGLLQNSDPVLTRILPQYSTSHRWTLPDFTLVRSKMGGATPWIKYTVDGL